MKGSAFWVGPPGASVAVGANGWLYWDLGDLDVRVHVQDYDGAYRPATVAIARTDGQPVTGEELRGVPLRRLSDALSTKAFESAVRTTWSQRGAPDLSPAAPHAVAAKRVQNFSVRGLADEAVMPVAAATSRTRKDDDFYFGMMDRYRTLAATSKRPAVELAQQHGVKVSTVHRWLREAKYRRALLVADVQRLEEGLRPE